MCVAKLEAVVICGAKFPEIRAASFWVALADNQSWARKESRAFKERNSIFEDFKSVFAEVQIAEK